MDELDLEQPASLWWLPVPLAEVKPDVGYTGDSRQFGSVRNAVRFCMGKLDPRLRPFARVEVDAGASISSDESAALYDKLSS